MDNGNNTEFIVTARKWRPQKFTEIVGQEHIADTLKNAIKSNRVHHAYLFTGPRGVGKTTAARIFARAVNCTNPQEFEPCNKCESCKNIYDNNSLDVLEIDGASNNSVDDIRQLRENAKYPPSTSKYKIYIIDEVHMLSKQAFNALLKTLEEPPKHLIFIFATTEPHKVLPTIISRCQKFDFRRMEINDIIKQTVFIAEKENITLDEESLVAIAKKADGSMRDSQSIFDQVIAFCGNNIHYKDLTEALNLIDEEFFFKITNAILAKNSLEMLYLSNEVIRRGYDLQETMQGLLEHIRNIISVKLTGDGKLIDSSEMFVKKYKEDSEKFETNDLIRLMTLINQAEQQLRFSPQPRIRFELTLLQLSTIDTMADIIKVLKQLDKIDTNKPVTTSSPEKKNLISNIPIANTISKTVQKTISNNRDLVENSSEQKSGKNKKTENDNVKLNSTEKFIIENFDGEVLY